MPAFPFCVPTATGISSTTNVVEEESGNKSDKLAGNYYISNMRMLKFYDGNEIN